MTNGRTDGRTDGLTHVRKAFRQQAGDNYCDTQIKPSVKHLCHDRWPMWRYVGVKSSVFSLNCFVGGEIALLHV